MFSMSISFKRNVNTFSNYGEKEKVILLILTKSACEYNGFIISHFYSVKNRDYHATLQSFD